MFWPNHSWEGRWHNKTLISRRGSNLRPLARGGKNKGRGSKEEKRKEERIMVCSVSRLVIDLSARREFTIITFVASVLHDPQFYGWPRYGWLFPSLFHEEEKVAELNVKADGGSFSSRGCGEWTFDAQEMIHSRRVENISAIGDF